MYRVVVVVDDGSLPLSKELSHIFVDSPDDAITEAIKLLADNGYKLWDWNFAEMRIANNRKDNIIDIAVDLEVRNV